MGLGQLCFPNFMQEVMSLVMNFSKLISSDVLPNVITPCVLQSVDSVNTGLFIFHFNLLLIKKVIHVHDKNVNSTKV